MASQAFSANDVQRSFFEIQHQGNGESDITYNVEHHLKHKPFHDYLSRLSPLYLQDSVLIFKDSDQDLVIDLEQLQADIHDGLKAKGYHGKFISIGSSKGQLKIQSLNELDLAYLLDRDKSNVIKVASKSHVYHVEKENKTLRAREFREKFGQDVHEILSNIKLPSRLAHSGYCSPKFSGIRYNGPATTMLLTWDPEGEAREISVDITPMFQLPPKDEQVMKRKITQKYRQIRDEMPREIFRFEGIYLFPNPISNQWELTTACYEATNLMPHLSHDTPFKSCIVMCKTMASLMASAVNSSLTSTPQETKIMKGVIDALSKPSQQTTEIMKYGHAFLTPSTGNNHKEMTKKAISINTAAITHITLDLASGMRGAFTSTHPTDEQQRITLQLATDVFWYLASVNQDVQHFFLGSAISLFSVATWSRQMYDTQQLINNTKTQCLLTAHLLAHWNIEELHQNVNEHIEEVPDENLQYIEDTFRVRAHFNGEGCNQTFCVVLKLANALGNTMGGIIQVHDPDSTDFRKQEMWEAAFRQYATRCDIMQNIQILNEENLACTIVLYVKAFHQRMPLTSYKIKLPVAQVTGKGIGEAIAYLQQQNCLIHQIHVYHISDNRQINSIYMSKEKSNYTGPTQADPAHREAGLSEVSEDERPDMRQTQAKPDEHRYESTAHVVAQFNSDVVPIDSVSIDEANEKLKMYKKLGWTTNKHDWEKNLRQINIDVESSAKELIDSENTTLKLTSPGTYIPSKQSILHRHPHLDQLLKSIEIEIGSKDALIFICDSWPRLVDIRMAPSDPIHNVLDVVIFDRLGTVDIWCMIDKIDDAKLSSIWQYAVSIGKSTKSSFHQFGQNLHIRCNVYSYSDNKTHRSSKLISERNDFGKKSIHVLACFLIRKNSHHRNSLGEEIDVYLTAKQMEIILQSACKPIIFIEGPPGSGKTVMAFHICSKYKPHQVLYICSTATFQNYLHFQENCRPELVQNDADMKRFIKRANLDNCSCIIIDDGHQLACSDKVWRKFLLMAKEKSCQVYIFADNQYQNFSVVHSEALAGCIEEMKRTGDASEHHLNDIHRNSRRVSSFLVASAADIPISTGSEVTIGCSSVTEGHDVEVQYISNVLEKSERNGLLQLIRSILLPGSVAGLHNVYTARDITILVDTKKARKDVETLKTIIKQFTSFQVHSAGRFPTEGITLDILDNFIGLEKKVCICIVRKAMKGKKQDSFPKAMESLSQLQNPKYRTFVASRGVSRVIFVIDVPISVDLARLMKMDLLSPVPRRMWTKDGYVGDVTWTAAAASPALWYSTESGDIRLVSESGESLPLQIDTAGIQDPSCVDSTPDGAAVLVTDGKKPRSWSVFARESGPSYRHQTKYQLGDMEPRAARWTPDRHIVMVVSEMSRCHLRKYRVSDGDLLWEVKDVGSVLPGWLSVCQQSGHILLTDGWRVRVYSPAGKLLHRVHLPDRLPDISSVCAVRKDTWLSGHTDGSVRLWGVSDTARAEHVLVDTGESDVTGLALSRDRLLAVRTGYGGKLIVYNVAGCLE